jgi:DNA-directed RNA polymerase subunit RPC12/RpoP
MNYKCNECAKKQQEIEQLKAKVDKAIDCLEPTAKLIMRLVDGDKAAVSDAMFWLAGYRDFVKEAEKG